MSVLSIGANKCYRLLFGLCARSCLWPCSILQHCLKEHKSKQIDNIKDAATNAYIERICEK